MAKLVNLTPHPLVIQRKDGSVFTLPSEGLVRLTTTRVVVGELDGAEVVKTTLGAPVGLPEPVDGTTFVVSRLVIDALPSRVDLVSPGEAIRDSEGKIIGAKGFSC